VAVAVVMVLVMVAVLDAATVMETVVLLVERLQAVRAVRAGHKLMPLVARAVREVLMQRLAQLVVQAVPVSPAVVAAAAVQQFLETATSLMCQQVLDMEQSVKEIK